FAALHPDRTGLLAKAAPRSGGGRAPGAARTSVCVHRDAGATPAPPFRRLMMAPSHEQAWRQYRGLGTAQEKYELPLARSVEVFLESSMNTGAYNNSQRSPQA